MVNSHVINFKTNKRILRVLLMLSYLVVTSIIVFLFSSSYSYFNTGADRSKLLHTEVKKVDQYLPKITWKEDGNEGREMNSQTLKNLENDYLDAWYIQQIAYKSNTTKGINDYFTENARKNLFAFIEHNKNENIFVDSTTLEHHPDILFFSEDGQLIVLEDKNVIQYKKVFKNNQLLFEVTEKSDYKIILLAEDGFWRIRHIIKENTSEVTNQLANNSFNISQIKGINYYPQATPWKMFGDEFDAKVIANDFEIIKNAGLNTIRVFIPYEDFGKAKVKDEKLHKLTQVLDLAEKSQLKVILTLFDFYGNYETSDWTLNHRHAETIVSTFKNHPALLAWDLKNEPNLDFDSRGKQQIISWLEHLIVLVKSIDEKHPITIGWSNAESATILKDKVDFISFHYYGDYKSFENIYDKIKEEAPNKGIILGEFGTSSYSGLWKPIRKSKNKQATYHREMQKILTYKNIPFISWTLYDFDKIPKEVIGRLPWRTQPQKKFGFIDSKGNKKPSFQYISKE
ncbi:cellulase (glycosyl hydrolase family 5) [Tenacibaculum skagerrakense]|uniref:Cellulase (Glycosyl hydrolase family 5) n=1 Tax=Tenacibaculum skagerrakense TaxID=186571 RepID=A0A4V2SLG1_9FLAO|nr:glycoside hydrolase family 2 TIM barrel-domain containing protein [Tenacibaculum skagerrakense]TCP23296.1 cellulase (glycosyl hydrolase family 5) [Tenacibaculum skagerrakense]